MELYCIFAYPIQPIKTPIMIGYYNLLLSVSLVFVFALSACVSPRVVEDLKKKTERCESENESLKNENEKLTTSNNELNATLEDMRKRMKGLERDTSILGTSLEKMTKNYNQINDLYELLLDEFKSDLNQKQQSDEVLEAKRQKKVYQNISYWHTFFLPFFQRTLLLSLNIIQLL